MGCPEWRCMSVCTSQTRAAFSPAARQEEWSPQKHAREHKRGLVTVEGRKEGNACPAIKGMAWGPRPPMAQSQLCKSQLCHRLAVWPWASNFASLASVSSSASEGG